MKKLILALLTALLLHAGGATAQSIRLRLPDTTALVGSSFLLPVYVDSSFTGRNVISYQVQLSYTASHLLADSLVTGGTLSAGANPIANFGSSGLVTVAAATATPLSGTGVLFYVRFRVISTLVGIAPASILARQPIPTSIRAVPRSLSATIPSRFLRYLRLV